MNIKTLLLSAAILSMSTFTAQAQTQTAPATPPAAANEQAEKPTTAFPRCSSPIGNRSQSKTPAAHAA